MKQNIFLAVLMLVFAPFAAQVELSDSTLAAQEKMMYSDTSRVGVPYSKDPHVVNFKGRYLMYYSIPPTHWNDMEGWNIGIAESHDLVNWQKVGEITPQEGLDYEEKGLCAPCALVVKGKVHLFYQTYGNRERDAICHAVSKDGLHFDRDKTNPIFHPEPADWTCGRAIDAEVAFFKGKYYLYYATRDPEFKVQKMGVAVADGKTDFSRGSWKEACTKSILYPHLLWEKQCIEAPSVLVKGNTMFMFYAGGYNNEPQQIGMAKSYDGVNFTRCGPLPFKRNGDEGEWNSSESGHPHVFQDKDGKVYLFYQGNNDHGKTWYISQEEILTEKTKKGYDYLFLQSEKDRKKQKSHAWVQYDDMPHFAGGDDKALAEFVKENAKITCPGECCSQGKVIVSFLVDLDGTTSDFRIEHGLCKDKDVEALRVAKLIPMKAGKDQWKPVRYNVPITFTVK